ncbi:hypothetical protein HY627_02425 [Candidatus Uhrbacteria bacterium]|nr:hypothetical protein [Candidatus Uhrbacteria bacterium]
MKFILQKKTVLLVGIALAVIGVGGGVLFFYPRIQVEVLRAAVQKGENAAAIMPIVDENAKKLFDADSANDVASYNLLGVYAAHAGDKRLALWFYRAALTREPLNPTAIHNSAIVYEEMQDYTRAEAFHRRYLDLYPSEMTEYRALADMYRYRFPNGEQKIVDLMNEGLIKTGDHPDLLTWMISYYQETGQPEKAIPYSQKLLKKIPTPEQKKK